MQQEQIPESKKLLNQRLQKEKQINMQLIAETSLDRPIEDEDQKIQVLIGLQVIHLEWLNIKRIENLQVFQHLTILYLQHNLIARIEGLDYLVNLEYLALNDNRISTVQNLSCLKKLQGLNLSNNSIQEINHNELPPQLEVLSFKNNPVCLDVDYKQSILRRLKSLEMLDDQAITPAEKFKILGLFPTNLSSYASQMNHFYTKKEIKSKIEEESRPLLFNTEPINEKQALGEIRQKTRKYLYQNQEVFKRELKQQNDAFGQRIAVSRKIRNIKEKEEKDRQKRLEEIKESTLDKLMMNMSTR